MVFDEGLQFLANLGKAFGWLRALASSSREAGDGGGGELEAGHGKHMHGLCAPR